jgi:hypothetical protein
MAAEWKLLPPRVPRADISILQPIDIAVNVGRPFH